MTDRDYAYDLFLSFSGAHRESAREVAAELTKRGRRVFFDEESILAGKRWVEALAKGLREARGLVSIVGQEPSNWQRAEVYAFRPRRIVRQRRRDRALRVPRLEPPVGPGAQPGLPHRQVRHV
ncbi:MAG: toll/interleukin-1 receptor domain-containing protein [Planctomycetes bacterium]|nr:toll/interleukin-1 receptor domain-containing protein [Planctomycetota bacterium]